MSEIWKEGKITVVARTGGIKLDTDRETWLNPTDEYKMHVVPEMKGKDVKVRLCGHNKFDKILPREADATMINVTEDKVLSHRKEPVVNDREKLIIRQSCLKAAAEVSGTVEEILAVAEAFEEWVNR